MNKYERELVSTEAFTTRLQIAAEGQKTRALISIIATGAFVIVARYIRVTDVDTSNVIKFFCILLVFYSIYCYFMGIRLNRHVLEFSSRATGLRYGTAVVDGEHELSRQPGAVEKLY